MRRLVLIIAAGCSSRHAPEDAPAPDAPVVQLQELRFAVVGDTRPANIDDTANYPTDIVRAIWADVEMEGPPFAVTTGDYMFASTVGNEVDPQLDLYLGARSTFTGMVYPAMGNHECTGYTASNCGPGASDRQQAVVMINNWGNSFPLVYIPYKTLDRLIREDGEIACVVDKPGS